MNDTRAIHPAEERLLDAALAQLFAGRRAAAKPARAWLAAALVLLGVLITATTMWLARTAGDATAQEPEPLPPSVSAEGRAEIERLPADTANLIARVLSPADVAALDRFRSLRKLVLIPLDVHVGPINTRQKVPAWSAPPDDTLAPLAALPALECVQIASQIAVPPATLAPLAASSSLRELQFAGEHVRIDDAFVKALGAIPSLRALRLDVVKIDAAAVVRLRSLGLRSLAIERPEDFDGAAWRELCASPSLAELTLGWLGRPKHHVREESYWMPGPADLRALASLTNLRHVALLQCAVTDEHVAALPTTLTDLHLRGHELTPEGFRALKHVGALRRLDVNTARYDLRVFASEPVELRSACADAIAEALGTLRLTELRFQGKFTAALREALTAQPDLATLEIYPTPTSGFDDLARTPSLRRLRLNDSAVPTHLTPDALAPLRDCRSLQRLELSINDVRGEPGFDDAGLRRRLGDRIELHVQRELFTVKK